MSDNIYQAPESDLGSQTPRNLEYGGFWRRALASVIDTILLAIITLPILYWLYGEQYFEAENVIHGFADFLISYILPAVAVILFWIYRQATPGKIVLDMKIVHAETGAAPSAWQMVGRYAGYYLSGILLGLGFLWVAFDKRKQGWHDKLAKTVVVRCD